MGETGYAAPQLHNIELSGESHIELHLPASTSRDVLEEYVRSEGFSVHCVEFGENQDAGLATPLAIVVESSQARRLVRGNSTTAAQNVIALTGFGETSVGDLIESGEVDAEIVLPITCRDVRPLLRALAAGSDTWLDFKKQMTRSDSVAASASFAGLKVLAADDSAVNREVLSQALARLDVEVTCVENGAEALAAAQDGSFDLVFMDASMPVMDGFEAARQIRDHERQNGLSRLPVVALTAHVAGGVADAWRAAGMDDCVTKPFTLSSIEQCLFKHVPEFGNANDESDSSAKVATRDRPASGDATVDGESADPILDITVLESILQLQSPGDDLVDRVIQLYATHAPTALSNLRDKINAGEAEAVAAAAHALKSLCRNVGGIRLGNLCDRVEG